MDEVLTIFEYGPEFFECGPDFVQTSVKENLGKTS